MVINRNKYYNWLKSFIIYELNILVIRSLRWGLVKRDVKYDIIYINNLLD